MVQLVQLVHPSPLCSPCTNRGARGRGGKWKPLHQLHHVHHGPGEGVVARIAQVTRETVGDRTRRRHIPPGFFAQEVFLVPLRRCLDCNTLTPGTRCRSCTSRRKAIRNADRLIAHEVVTSSPVCSCSGCKLHPGPCRATSDLTADHVVPLARGGTNFGPRATLCRRCNSSKGAR